MRKHNRNAWPLQTDVAKALNIPITAVSKFCKKQGWSNRGSGHRPPLTPEQVKVLIEHFAPRVSTTTLNRARQLFHNYMYGVNANTPLLLCTHNDNTHTTQVSTLCNSVYTETHFVY